MEIDLLYFAALRDLAQKDGERVSLPPGWPGTPRTPGIATIAALRAHLESTRPGLAGRLGVVRFARNEAFAEDSDPIADGDVIALLPPVSGG